jgi:uridine kinase
VGKSEKEGGKQTHDTFVLVLVLGLMSSVPYSSPATRWVTAASGGGGGGNGACGGADESSSGPDEIKPAFIIGIAGGSASGKTSLCHQIHSLLPNQRVAIVAQDSFYRNLTPDEIRRAAQHNFDEPAAFDWPLMHDVLASLRRRRKVDVPTYDYKTHSRSDVVVPLWNIDVVLFEGILAFHDEPDVRMGELMDLKIFVETDSDTRLARRVFRDTQNRGRSLESVLLQYERFVKPSFEQYILPLKKRADVIIPWGDYSQNMFSDDGSWQSQRYPALEMIVEHIQTKLASFGPPPIRTLSPASLRVHESLT